MVQLSAALATLRITTASIGPAGTIGIMQPGACTDLRLTLGEGQRGLLDPLLQPVLRQLHGLDAIADRRRLAPVFLDLALQIVRARMVADRGGMIVADILGLQPFHDLLLRRRDEQGGQEEIGNERRR